MGTVVLLTGQAILGWLWSVTLLPMPRRIWVHVRGVGVVLIVLLSQWFWDNEAFWVQSFLLVSTLYWLHHQYGVFSWLERFSRLIFVPFFLACWGPIVDLLPLDYHVAISLSGWLELLIAWSWWGIFVKSGLKSALLMWRPPYLIGVGGLLQVAWWLLSRYQLQFETRYQISLELTILMVLGVALLVTRYLRHVRQEPNAPIDAYVVDLEQQVQTLRLFKHDYVNTLRVLEDSLHSGNLSDVTAVYESALAPTQRQLKAITPIDVTYLPTLLRSLLRQKYSRARQNNIEMTLSVTGEWQTNRYDEWALYQLLAIYLDNAIEASQPNTTIMVRFNAVQIPFVQVGNASQTRPNPSLWQRDGYTTKAQHSGLGLTSAHRIEKHQGWQNTLSWEDGYVVQTVTLGG